MFEGNSTWVRCQNLDFWKEVEHEIITWSTLRISQSTQKNKFQLPHDNHVFRGVPKLRRNYFSTESNRQEVNFLTCCIKLGNIWRTSNSCPSLELIHKSYQLHPEHNKDEFRHVTYMVMKFVSFLKLLLDIFENHSYHTATCRYPIETLLVKTNLW